MPISSDDERESVVRRPSRAEPETARQEVRLENRLKHDLASGLHDVVPDRKIRQRPQPAHHGFGIIAVAPGAADTAPASVQQPDRAAGNTPLPGTSQGGPVDAGSGVVPVHF